MDFVLNNVLFNEYINLLKDKMWNALNSLHSSLTPLQKKVTLVAVAIISAVGISYLIYRCCNFRAASLGKRKAIHSINLI